MGTANPHALRVAYEEESAWGTTPASASTLFRHTGDPTRNDNRNELTSAERRPDQQPVLTDLGHSMSDLSLSFEAHYKAELEWIRAFLRHDTSTGDYQESIDASTNNLTWAQSDSSLTRASGDWTAENIAVNMKIRYTGAGTNAGVFTVASITATKITFDETVQDETLMTGTHLFEGHLAENGTSDTSFTVEFAYNDESLVDHFVGHRVSGFSLSGDMDGIVTGSFNTVGLISSTQSEITASPSAYDSGDFVTMLDGTFTEGGSASTIVTGFDFQGNNGYRAIHAAGAAAVQEVDYGQFEVSGTLRLLFQSKTELDKFRDATASSLEIALQDGSGNELNVRFPAIRYTGGGIETGNEDNLLVSLPFRAYRDSTTGATMIVNAVPATATAP